MDEQKQIEFLKSQNKMLLDRIEGRAAQYQFYYNLLSSRADFIKKTLDTSLPQMERERLNGYMQGLIEGMVYLNNNLRSGTMPFDGLEFNKDEDEKKFL